MPPIAGCSEAAYR